MNYNPIPKVRTVIFLKMIGLQVAELGWKEACLDPGFFISMLFHSIKKKIQKFPADLPFLSHWPVLSHMPVPPSVRCKGTG